ncbi:MAG TPA: terminase TerL endonuclease subunit, partial [Dehalococcoidia bacterium]|nr:terminase TerL endonuclease subunit [Dehalococcoidia bacterium]
MGRPALSLLELVRRGTFIARRPTHRALLLGAPLPWPHFVSFQRRYAAATSEAERRAIALAFERLMRSAHSETERRSGSNDAAAALARALAALGNEGSSIQLLAFFPHYLRHTKGPLLGQPFQLEPFQKQFLREFNRRDKKGRRVYRFGLFGIARGCGKTPLAAGLSLYELVRRTDAPEIYCAANSKEQAQITLNYARGFVEQSDLQQWVQLKSGLLCPASRGRMQVISAEGRLQHGRMPSAAIFDELWAVETNRQEQTYIAIQSALHKRPDAYSLVISTAGSDKQSLLGRIYETALTWPQVEISRKGFLTTARDLEHGQLMVWYAAPSDAAIDDPAVWRGANPASWIDTAELKRQLAAAGLNENDFRRFNLNQWTETNDAWLPAGVWNDLQTDSTVPDGSPIFVGVDIGILHDTSAVCWAHVLPDGRILLNVRVWSVDPAAPAHHYLTGRIELGQIEEFILELARRYRLHEVAYDPHFFQRSAELLEAKGLTMIEFLQASGPMRDAYQSFYQLALEGRLAHSGDPVFTRQINGTAAQKTERGWRL